MSAVQAERPLRRRALEKQGMTKEQELELLIQEQQADDIYFVSRPPKEISLEGPSPTGGRWIQGESNQFVSDVVGVTEDGEIISFLPRSNDMFLTAKVKHSSFDAYNNHGCRCRSCKTFMADYRRRRRAERQAA